jgi:hypothetical protein
MCCSHLQKVLAAAIVGAMRGGECEAESTVVMGGAARTQALHSTIQGN